MLVSVKIHIVVVVAAAAGDIVVHFFFVFVSVMCFILYTNAVFLIGHY